MSGLRFEQITKKFGAVAALDDVSFEAAEGEFVVLLGPSGCGKSTLLRIAAGLDEPGAGAVWLGGRDVTHLEPRDRDVAMVFQSYALYPHLTVFGNIAYPLKVRKRPQSEIENEVRALAARLGLDGMLNRLPKELSGGQRQRVALARAIVRRPKAFLMDEPLSNLDARLRVEMRAELKHLQHELATVTLYVTHDQAEAMTMAHRIVVLDHGRVRQVGTPSEIYHRPANLFVAGFLGSPPMNFFDAALWEPGRAGQILGVRPEDVELASSKADGFRAARVYAVEDMGNESFIVLQADDLRVTARLAAAGGLSFDQPVWYRPRPGRVHYFDQQTTEAIE